MKNIQLIKTTLLASAMVFTLNSCVKDDDYKVPTVQCNDRFPATNHTLSDLAALGKVSPAKTDIISQDFIVEGFVSSSDESGNIYKTLYVQDSPNNPTQAIEIDIDGGNNYTNYPVGAKVRINAKGLIVQAQNGNVKLGAYDPSYAVGRINPNFLTNYMARTCENGFPVLATMVPVEFSSFAEAQKPQHINKLVKIKNVQFKNDATGLGDPSTPNTPNTFADKNSASGASDRALEDQSATSMVIRNSTYASFASTVIKEKYSGSGDLTMILSLYTSASGSKTWQGYIRDLNDLKFNAARFTLNIINFENYAVNDNVLAPYYNNVLVGTGAVKWKVATYNNNKYIQVSANALPGALKNQFAIPVTFNGQNKLSFKTNAGYYNGDPLKVYWSLDYNPANPSAATLYDITSSFDISKGIQPIPGPGANYETTFRPSGVKSLPTAATGAGYIIFEYTGSGIAPILSTTMQLDDINFL